MEILRSLSVLYSLAFVPIIFLILYDLRYEKKKNILISVAVLTPLFVLAAISFFLLGHQRMVRHVFTVMTLPCLILFFFMSEKRDSKFLFTFCLVDTLCLELITLTSILEALLGGDMVIFLFALRLVLFPVLAFLVWKYLRTMYLQLQTNVHASWNFFAAVSLLNYGLIAYMTAFPTIITDRPDDIPTVLMVFTLMPLTYIAIFRMLLGQMQYRQAEELHLNAEKQAELLQTELDIGKEYVEAARQNRHDMRHILRVALEYLKHEDYQGAAAYLSEYEASIAQATLPTYCDNLVINALLRGSIRRCHAENIDFRIQATVPKELPYTNIEAGILFGNLIENAYEAARKCENPFIEFTARCKDGCLLVELRNSVSVTVEFLEGYPVSTKLDGGIGTRSADAILAKHGGMMKLSQEGDVFITQVLQPLENPFLTE